MRLQICHKTTVQLLVRLLAVGCCAAVLSACASHANAPWAELGRDDAARAENPPLAVGDKLKITIFEEPELSGSFTIAPTGTLSLPLIGRVRAAGTRVSALRQRLVQRYSQGYLKTPQIAIEVENYRPIFVHGEVRQGGEFPYRTGLTLRDAIAVAGGYTYRAEESYVLLMRGSAPGPVKIGMPSSAPVLPGDNIRIPERFF